MDVELALVQADDEEELYIELPEHWQAFPAGVGRLNKMLDF